MAIIIKKMETEAEWLEKAQVQWQAWQETYTGLVDQSFLDALSVEKLAEKRPRGGEDILIAKDGSQVWALSSSAPMATSARRRWARSTPYISCALITTGALATP